MEEKLIRLVRSYDYLYNFSSSHYMNTQMKNNAWDSIGTKLNKTGEECQKIWSNIRSNFRKALINRKSNSGKPYKKRRPIKHEKELEFLKKFIQQRNQTSNMDSSSEDTLASYAGEFAVDGNEESRLSRMIIYPKTSSTTAADPTTANELLKHIQSKKELDPIDSFFQTMAATTKKLPEKVQVQIKRQIFNIVNEAEFNHIQENEIRLVSASAQASISEDPLHTNHSTASTSGSGLGTASGIGHEAASGSDVETPGNVKIENIDE